MQARNEKRRLSGIMHEWIFIVIGVAFVATIGLLWKVQTRMMEDNIEKILRINITDVKQDISDASDVNLLRLANSVAYNLDNRIFSEEDPRVRNFAGKGGKNALLAFLADLYEVQDITVIDENGIITHSTNEDYLGFDMASGAQSAEFLCLLDGETKYYVQAYMPSTYDPSVSKKFAGVVLKEGGFIQVSYDAELFQEDIDDDVIGLTQNRHVGESGGIIIADEKGIIVSGVSEIQGKSLTEAGLTIDPSTLEEGKVYRAERGSETYDCMFAYNEGYYILAYQPEREVVRARDLSIKVIAVMETLILAALFLDILFIIRRFVLRSLKRVNDALDEIETGNLDVEVDVRTSAEFSKLSDELNETVKTLKGYIAAEKERINNELEYAKNIQSSVLPSVFPPFPDRPEFDIFAMMRPAREVGGDFYDFFFVGNTNRLALLVADVSGKGIPAALFMMRAKTLLNSNAHVGMDMEETFRIVNNALCEGNESGMFVTAWMGIIDVTTGEMDYICAGHNPPLLRRQSGRYEYLREKPSFILAGMEGVSYKKYSLTLGHGDRLFLYTDGVTEATSAATKLFGEERLQMSLNLLRGSVSAEDTCKAVLTDVETFVGEAPQFDDITMLSFKMN